MRRALLCVVLLLWSAVSVAAPSDRKVALVIGNGAYTGTSPLPNPPADAKLMAQSLRDVGFEVIEKTDLGRRDMLRAIVEFGDKLEEGGVGLFFYAGHGIQVGGANFLVPVDADIKREEHVEAEAVDVNSVLRTMDAARNRLNLVVLDACRNNPFARSFRSAGGGLAQIKAPSGTLIAYATAPGQVAEDGKGANSPYTTALSKAMKTPGLTAEETFKRVRIDVSASTSQRQTPWESSSLTGDFYFAGAPKPGGAPAQASTPAAPSAGGGKEVELAYWNSVKDSKDPGEIRSYTQKYPNGEFAGLAEMRIKALESQKGQQTAAVTAPPAPARNVQLDPIDAEYVVTRAARVRSEPTLDAQAVSNLSPGTKVMVVGKVKGHDWMLVEQGGKRLGYVPSGLVMDALAYAEQQKKNQAAQAAQAQQVAAAPPAAASRNVAPQQQQPAQPTARMVNVRGVYYQNRNFNNLQEMTARSLQSLPNTQVTRDTQPRQQPNVDVVGTVDFVNIQDVAPQADPNAAGAAAMGAFLGGVMGGRLNVPQQQQQRATVQNRIYQTRVTMTATDYRSGKVITESADAQQQFSTQVAQDQAINQVTNQATSDVIVKMLSALSR